MVSEFGKMIQATPAEAKAKLKTALLTTKLDQGAAAVLLGCASKNPLQQLVVGRKWVKILGLKGWLAYERLLVKKSKRSGDKRSLPSTELKVPKLKTAAEMAALKKETTPE
jgi:hypothetical protein